MSTPGTTSRRRRAPPTPGTALGLEDEIQFGSDEDLMEEIGEIKIAKPTHDYLAPTSSLVSRSTLSRKKEEKHKKREDKLLAQSAVVLPPASEHGKIEKKKKGFLGGLKGFGKKSLALNKGVEEGRPSDESFGEMTSHGGSGISSQATSPSSYTYSYDNRLEHSRHSPLAPIDTTPFGFSPASKSNSSDSHRHVPQTPRDMAKEPSVRSDLSSSASATSLIPPSMTTGSSHRSPSIPSSYHTPAKRQDEHQFDQSISHTGGILPQAASSRFEASPFGNDLTHLLLPAFPTQPTSLESITILSAVVMKRSNPSNRLSDKGSSRSLSNFRPGTGGSNPISFNLSSKPVWISHQLILTSFKISGPTPHTSPNPNADPLSAHHREPSTTQTIAHLHLFTIPQIPKSSRPPTSGSSSSRGSLPRSMAIEVERKRLSGRSTAGVWDEAEGGDRMRKSVLRIGVEEEEWLCDFADPGTMHEWLKKIKSLAVIIRAEATGYGDAIRDAYNSGHVSDLAMELDMHAKGLRSSRPHRYSDESAIIHEADDYPTHDQDITNGFRGLGINNIVPVSRSKSFDGHDPLPPHQSLNHRSNGSIGGPTLPTQQTYRNFEHTRPQGPGRSPSDEKERDKTNLAIPLGLGLGKRGDRRSWSSIGSQNTVISNSTSSFTKQYPRPGDKDDLPTAHPPPTSPLPSLPPLPLPPSRAEPSIQVRPPSLAAPVMLGLGPETPASVIPAESPLEWDIDTPDLSEAVHPTEFEYDGVHQVKQQPEEYEEYEVLPPVPTRFSSINDPRSTLSSFKPIPVVPEITWSPVLPTTSPPSSSTSPTSTHRANISPPPYPTISPSGTSTPTAMFYTPTDESAMQQPLSPFYAPAADELSIADSGSIAPSESSAGGTRRRKAKSAVVDLMSEMSSRSELNFGVEREEVVVSPKTKTKKGKSIRFAG